MADPALSEDVVQNAFAQIFSKASQYEGRSALRAWMRRIVVNEALMLLRKRKSTRIAEADSVDALLPKFDSSNCRVEEPAVDTPDPEQIAMKKEFHRIVLHAMESLPETYRLAMLLRDIEERSTSETAKILGISEANVKVRLHRARSALKAILDPVRREGRLW